MSFQCQGCGWRTSFEGLARLASFACSCGGALVPSAVAPTESGGSGSFPAPPGSATYRPPDGDFLQTAFGSTRFRGELQAGQTLGQYRLERELGRGANGVVFLARRPGLERDYALKVLLEDTIPDAETVARFELEAAIGSKLRDPGVIPVFDVGRVQDWLFYAMEYAPGPTLKEVIHERGRLPWREAVEICRQLALTLAHCHERSVIHRDLKPGNVILDSELNRPRVTDFGLARDRTLAQRMTETGDWLGTPYYMSPEQFLGESDLDHRADIYALGVILYETSTGERPFVAKSARELMEVVLDGSPPAPRAIVSDLPAGLDHVAQKAMATNADDRYSDARAMASDLEALLAGSRLAPQRNRLLAGAVLIGAVVFLAAALVFRQARSMEGAGPSTAQVGLSPASSLAVAPTPGAGAVDWTQVLADPATWAGTRDLAAVRARASAAEADRVDALVALVELGKAANRGAPWRDLNVILKRARRPKGWIAYQSRLDLTEARLRLARGLSRAALSLLDKKRSRRALWLRTLAHRQRGEAEKAALLIASLATQQGPEASLAKASAAREEGNVEAALALIEEAQGHIPGARLELAQTLHEAGDSTRAKAALSGFLEAWGPTPPALRLQGDLHLKRGELKLALAAYEGAAKLLELDLDAALDKRRAETLLRADRSEEAEAFLDELIPPARSDEELPAAQVDALVLRGVARHNLNKAAGAGQDWRRAHRASQSRAEAALPAEAADSVRAAYRTAVGDVAPAMVIIPSEAPGPEEMREALEMLRELSEAQAQGPWNDVRPLGPLPKEAAKLYQAPPDASQGVSDVAAARRLAAEGKSWRDVLFYLRRALDSAASKDLARATWIRIAIGRGQALEAVEDRLEKNPAAYGLKGRRARFAQAEVIWLRGRSGEALVAFQALAKAEPETLEGALADATVAFLERDFETARTKAADVAAVHTDGRGFALAGLAEIALAKFEGAAKSQRLAYALLGASDYRVLALRGALSAGREQEGSMFSAGSAAKTQLELVGRPADLLALAVLAESEQDHQRAFFVERLAAIQSADSAELSQLRGYSLVRRGEGREECLRHWKTARTLDPALPIPESYLEAYAKAYGTKAGLADFR